MRQRLAAVVQVNESRTAAGTPAAVTARVRYDVRVRTVLGPAVRASLAPSGHWTTVGRGMVLRFCSNGERDLNELYGVLIRNNVDVIGVRSGVANDVAAETRAWSSAARGSSVRDDAHHGELGSDC
jgi:hypothetical protein